MPKTKLIIPFLLSSTLALAFDFGSALKSTIDTVAPTEKKEGSTSSLSEATITSGLKEALKVGVEHGVKELSKEGGYLNNKLVKIPLPDNLKKVESLVRKAGGDDVADDLIISMNKAATKAAPQTASIFMDAITKMTLDDAKKILAGDDDAATQYFQKHTTDSLTKMIKPIIHESMEENKVASYYNTFNEYYKGDVKDYVENNALMNMAKGYGADEYMPKASDENLDDYVTRKAIDGLFVMIAQKEGEIRTDPVAQTTNILKKVFGN